MSDLYGSLYQQLEPKRFKKDDGGPDPTRMEVGMAFEETLELAIAQRLFGARPGEFVTQHERDCTHANTVVEVGDPVCPCGAGVIYSPDHFLFNGSSYGGEFKATWMSIRKGVRDSKFDKWFTQMKVYGHHLKMTRWKLYALFINGDYSWKPPYGQPHMRAWDITFTVREMADEWGVLVRHGKKVGLIP